ncbi:synaptogyrin-2 [Pelobates cultripes]|uniref:Synaptogyrin n=1 Tax=Pelobates cultripes TaxID=61616 RepID=A0AAD1S2M3_PELCU|nr:synaptogyrin-2 [Pelobates cultripes]
MESGAYGAAKAGGSFSFESFLRRPETVLRVASAVFAIIVFACILTDGYPSDRQGQVFCIFGGNADACRYGIGIGVIAFFACGIFLSLDVYFPNLSNSSHRKYIVQSDFGFSALWSFLWFVGFCFLAHQWSIELPEPPLTGQSNARAAIAFSFFSILSWVPLALLAYKRYRMGVADFNPNYVDPSQDTTPPYSSYPDAVTDNYQQPPFTNNPDAGDGYKPPLY